MKQLLNIVVASIPFFYCAECKAAQPIALNIGMKYKDCHYYDCSTYYRKYPQNYAEDFGGALQKFKDYSRYIAVTKNSLIPFIDAQNLERNKKMEDTTVNTAKQMRTEIDSFFETHKTEREVNISGLMNHILQLPASYTNVIDILQDAGFKIYRSDDGGYVKSKPVITARINSYRSVFGQSHDIIACLDTDSFTSPTVVKSVEATIFASFL